MLIPAAPAAPPTEDDGLVPLPAEETRRAKVTPPEAGPSSSTGEDLTGSYNLAGEARRKKVKAVRVREGASPDFGANAKGVRQAAAATKTTLTPREILAAFHGEIEPVQTSPAYVLWMLIVAGVMALLPLIYLALIVLLVVGAGYHAVYDLWLLEYGQASARAKVIAGTLYLGPLVCAPVMVVFMLKPLFARSSKGAQRRALDPEHEPLLYAFVDGICASVGAPRPARIEVDCEVNASAGYSGGPFAFASREPVLIIGLGMVVGLSLKQFAGVMAHELGHLAGGSGARTREVAASINVWLARVVYERDEWDESLRVRAAGANGGELFAVCARFAIWLTRRVLWLLLHLAYLVNLAFMRQREYDADRYEARMVGAKTFAKAMWRMRELGLSSEYAMADLRSSWEQRRLPDNYPKLILANVPQIPKEMLARFREASGQAKTSLFSTHPSDRDRIDRAKLEAPDEGIFNLDGPASDLFAHFDSLCRLLTFEYYKSMLGRDISKSQLYPVVELVESQAVAQEGYVTADRFFLEALPITQSFALPHEYPKAPAQAKAAKQALDQARNEQRKARSACLAALERSSETSERLTKAEAALMLLKAGYRVHADDWELDAPTIKAAEAARDRAQAELEGLTTRIESYTQAASRRLIQALAMLEVDVVADRVSDGRDRREEARVLYPCTAHLGTNVVVPLGSLLQARNALVMILGLHRGDKDAGNEPLINAILRGANRLRDNLEELRWRVGDMIDYPFEHAKEDMTLARFALPQILPEKNDIGGLLDVANMALERLFTLYRRALGRLTVTAEEVERVVGLKPIVFKKAGDPSETRQSP